LESGDESRSYSTWVVEGSFWTSYETQYDDRRTMGGAEEEKAWLFDGQ